jgi:hypothetical protein
MTLFGTEWNKMLAVGDAPRECFFAPHSTTWYAAREACRRHVRNIRAEETKDTNAKTRKDEA